jgi:hypothetical protein
MVKLKNKNIVIIGSTKKLERKKNKNQIEKHKYYKLKLKD